MAFRKILVTGNTGMLGQDLIPYLAAKGYDVVGSSTKHMSLLETMGSLQQKIELLGGGQLDMIIHTAAMTDVDQAELNPDLAMAVNFEGTQKLAVIARELDAIFVYVSTDYVFDGTKGTAYLEDDTPNPISVYGLSKHRAELAVQEILPEAYIVRTSWLYGKHRRNFVQFILDATRQGRKLEIIDDQIGSPTWTGSVATLLETIITSGAFGIYHAADLASISRYQQAVDICTAAGLDHSHISPIPSTAFPQAAKRPPCSPLASNELQLAQWKTALQAYLVQYLNQNRKKRSEVPF